MNEMNTNLYDRMKKAAVMIHDGKEMMAEAENSETYKKGADLIEKGRKILADCAMELLESEHGM